MPGTAPAGVSFVEWLLLLPVIGGSIYSVLCLGAMAVLRGITSPYPVFHLKF